MIAEQVGTELPKGFKSNGVRVTFNDSPTNVEKFFISFTTPVGSIVTVHLYRNCTRQFAMDVARSIVLQMGIGETE